MLLPLPKLILSYLLTAGVFFAIDIVWIGVIGNSLYKKYIGKFMGDVNWPAAGIFYSIFIAGVLLFAVFPAVEQGTPQRALALGAALGFLCYATYDLTNLATLKGWPWQIVLIDMLWGTVLTASVSVAGYYNVRWLAS